MLLWEFVRVASTLLLKTSHLLLDQVETVVDRQVFGNVVNDQVQASLEDPRRGEEARPGLNSIVEGLGLRWHEEAWVSSDLAELRVAHLRLDDRVDEIKSEGVVFHLHGVQVVEGKLRDSLNRNGEFTAEVSLLGFEVNTFVDGRGREDVVADADIVDEDTLQLG